ncbi:M16 family metallopeptidase [Spiribacter onubensis]|uniref:M16 family metallopeptidase n=1 Tax=Spiribacter onubensis TaxID=3122420 RepID=UPI0038B4A584
METRIQQWRTGTGVRVLFVERRALPTVDIRLTFNAGSCRDGAMPGLARMTSNLLLEGTDHRDAGYISQQLEQHGARASTRCSRDTAELNVRSLSHDAHLKPVIAELGECISGSTFPAAALERIRQRMLAGLAQQDTAPMEMVEKAFTAAIFAHHPYATSPGGEPASLQSIDPDALRLFHRRYYVAANATLAVVGDLSRQEAERIAEQLVAQLPSGEPATALPLARACPAPCVVRIPLDAEQTHVSIGQPSPPQGHEDHSALHLGCHILGGAGLTSLLARRMRVERGLSYSSASRLTAGAAGGRFQMKTHVRNDALAEALAVLRESLQELLECGPEADALALARENLLGSLPLQHASNQDLIGHVSTVGFYDLPMDHIHHFTEQLKALDAQGVRDAMQRHLDPASMTTVTVGPESAINAVR